jgi:hypothetical protein
LHFSQFGKDEGSLKTSSLHSLEVIILSEIIVKAYTDDVSITEKTQDGYFFFS